MAAADDDLGLRGDGIRKVHPRIASAWIGATCNMIRLTNPTFVSFATSGSSPEMHVSTVMDEV